MLDGTDDADGNFAPPGFLPGPGLSPEEAFNKMTASAEEKLAKLGVPIPSPHALTHDDRNSQDSEARRRTLINRQASPAEASESDRYSLAEDVSQFPQGYFHPGMSDLRERQLAAIISAGTPQIVDHNTPGLASTSTAST